MIHFKIYSLIKIGTPTDSSNHPEQSAENEDTNNESTLEPEVQPTEDMPDSSSDIFYNYNTDSDSDEYYSLEDFDASTC